MSVSYALSATDLHQGSADQPMNANILLHRLNHVPFEKAALKTLNSSPLHHTFNDSKFPF
jgi:hypothetical protein